MVSSRLERFAQKTDDLYNFRCPICGDSKKNKLKSRGYIHRKGNDYFYMCHNCNFSTTFGKFLRQIDESTYRQYALERYTNGENSHSNYQKPQKPDFNLIGPKPSERIIKRDDIPLTKIKDLPDDHDAKKYILYRKIPSKYHNEIFYTDDITKFVKDNYPEAKLDLIDQDRRVVLFHTDIDGNVTYIVGRSIEEYPKIRYVKVRVKTDGDVIFGVNRIDRTKPIYVVEGQFDSMFIDNAVACGNSNLTSVADVFGKENVILIYDNEPRNKDINKLISRAIDKEYSVVIWPEAIKYKDVNDMILNGFTCEKINDTIKQCTHKGLMAKFVYSRWKKC